jgi:hypothetical protein
LGVELQRGFAVAVESQVDLDFHGLLSWEWDGEPMLPLP